MKLFSLWVVLSGLILSLMAGCGRAPQGRLPKLPEDKTVMLSICEEEQYSQKYLYTKKEVRALNKALAQVSVQPVDDWTIPEDPWPVYGLYVTDLWHDGRELDAACFGDLWVDNQGQAFRVEGLDMQALTGLFPDGWKEGKHNFLPSRQALALCGGSWNEQFMVPSDLPSPQTDVSMTLDDSSNGLSWTLTNLSRYEFFHGNGGYASLQVCLEDGWYDVPSQFSRYHTDEGHTLPPGESYSSVFPLEPYGDLPAGNYRIVFPMTQEGESQPREVYSAVYFLILEDGTFAQESLV